MFHTVQLRHQQNEQVLSRRHIPNLALFFMSEKSIHIMLFSRHIHSGVGSRDPLKRKTHIGGVQIRARIHIDFSPAIFIFIFKKAGADISRRKISYVRLKVAESALFTENSLQSNFFQNSCIDLYDCFVFRVPCVLCNSLMNIFER